MLRQDRWRGARNAETGMYTLVHEDFEYRATKPAACISILYGERLAATTLIFNIRIIKLKAFV